MPTGSGSYIGVDRSTGNERLSNSPVAIVFVIGVATPPAGLATVQPDRVPSIPAMARSTDNLTEGIHDMETGLGVLMSSFHPD